MAARSLLWPSLVAVAFASFYVVTQPGPLDYNDAYDYDHLAKSILQGRYELSDDYKSPPLPTMQREPGYPAFRAAIYAIAGDRPNIILWIQALLAGITVLLTGLTVRRLDNRWSLPVAWLVALYPGFAVWTGQHYSEIFAAFLVAPAAYVWVRLWEARDAPMLHSMGVPLTSKLAISSGLLLGALSLTRASFQVLPIFAAGLLIAGGEGISLPLRSRRARWKQALLVIVGFLIVVAPWVIRNGRTFGQYSITYRIGIILHMRALEAEASWSELGTSYGSVLFGEATMLRLFPATPPIVTQWWSKTWDVKLAHLGDGLRAYESDAIFLSQAWKKIFSSPPVFMRFALWSGIDELRLFGLSSPLSPKFGVELIANQEAKEGRLSWSKLGVVWGAHALQFLWWALIVTGFVVLVRARLWRHPSLLFVGYAAVMYAPLDNIPRYAVPILPWVMALIAAAIWPRRSRAAGRPRSTDQRLIEAANAAYHEAEAELYDAAHPEILWCERAHWEAFAARHLPGERQAVTILDVAAGTGFVGAVLAPRLRAGDRYIATDISSEMLEKLRGSLSAASFQVETAVAPADRLPMADSCADVVVINSALHHFPDVPNALREAARVLKPGGLLAVMHEPNVRFARSPFFRQVARFSSVLAARIDPKGSVKKPDYAPVFDHANRRLLGQGLIREPLSSVDIQALVDVHSPTARGRYEEVGFDPVIWQDGQFTGWTVEQSETYNFLGKLDPAARPWRRVLERLFSRLAPRSGSLFSIVWRKPLP